MLIRRVNKYDALIELGDEACSVSTVINGGFKCGIRYVLMHTVNRYFSDPIEEAQSALTTIPRASINNTLVFLTAVRVIESMGGSRIINGSLVVWALSTVGLSNPYTIINGQVYVPLRKTNASTVNILVATNANVSEPAAVDAIRMITETKALTLVNTHGITGTTSDAVAFIYMSKGPLINYTGPLTELGPLIVRGVYESLINAFKKSASKY